MRNSMPCARRSKRRNRSAATRGKRRSDDGSGYLNANAGGLCDRAILFSKKTPRPHFHVGYRRRLASDDLSDHSRVLAAPRRKFLDERLGLITRRDDDE